MRGLRTLNKTYQIDNVPYKGVVIVVRTGEYKQKKLMADIFMHFCAAPVVVTVSELEDMSDKQLDNIVERCKFMVWNRAALADPSLTLIILREKAIALQTRIYTRKEILHVLEKGM